MGWMQEEEQRGSAGGDEFPPNYEGKKIYRADGEAMPYDVREMESRCFLASGNCDIQGITKKIRWRIVRRIRFGQDKSQLRGIQFFNIRIDLNVIRIID